MSKIELKDNYTLEDLFQILSALRGENGCPWDKIQTHESLKKCLIEESYEAIDALDSGDDTAFANELGDVLLQVAFHSQLADERGAFNFDTVLYELCTKLIKRHTHVFGDVVAADPEAALANWEKNKNKELTQKSCYDVLNDVPHHLPGLMRAEKVQKKAQSFNAHTDSKQEICKKLKELTDKLSDCDENSARDLYRDFLFKAVNLGRSINLSAETEISAATNNFISKCKEEVPFENLKNVII